VAPELSALSASAIAGVVVASVLFLAVAVGARERRRSYLHSLQNHSMLEKVTVVCVQICVCCACRARARRAGHLHLSVIRIIRVIRSP
jgi:hypothetical protein